MPEEELILQFREKNIKAYEKLYNKYCDSISGVINNIVKNDDVAQEITQDVYLKKKWIPCIYLEYRVKKQKN